MSVLGWDIGGAHVKVARVGAAGALDRVVLKTCQLWRGLDVLCETLEELLPAMAPNSDPVRLHALTMSGEMVDFFADRSEGVSAIVDCLAKRVGEVPLQVLDAGATLRPAAAIKGNNAPEVASANWSAVPAWLAEAGCEVQFADLGSTTLDISAVSAGKVLANGRDDFARLGHGELVYVGVIRTPVFHFARELSVGGLMRPLVPELFADMGDVLLITGDLMPEAITQPALDGRDRSFEAAVCRLARSFGTDAGRHPSDWFVEAAAALKDCLIAQLARCLARQRLAFGVTPDMPLVVAGVGQSLLAEAAAARGWPVTALADTLRTYSTDADVASAAGTSAPAAATALLAAATLMESSTDTAAGTVYAG